MAETSEGAVLSSMSSEGLLPAMSRVNVEIELPDTLATQVEGLVEAREVLAANPLPPMTSEEIQAEIDAYRVKAGRAARP